MRDDFKGMRDDFRGMRDDFRGMRDDFKRVFCMQRMLWPSSNSSMTNANACKCIWNALGGS